MLPSLHRYKAVTLRRVHSTTYITRTQQSLRATGRRRYREESYKNQVINISPGKHGDRNRSSCHPPGQGRVTDGLYIPLSTNPWRRSLRTVSGTRYWDNLCSDAVDCRRSQSVAQNQPVDHGLTCNTRRNGVLTKSAWLDALSKSPSSVRF